MITRLVQTVPILGFSVKTESCRFIDRLAGGEFDVPYSFLDLKRTITRVNIIQKYIGNRPKGELT